MADILVFVTVVFVKMIDPIPWCFAVPVGALATEVGTKARIVFVIVGAAMLTAFIVVFFPASSMGVGFHSATTFFASAAQIGFVVVVVQLWRNSRRSAA
jgi:hypothetical protein